MESSRGPFPPLGRDAGPSRFYYALAGAIFVAGWVLFGIFLYRNISKLPEKLQQLVVPGKTDITLAKAGTYTIYHEYRSTIGSRVYSNRRYIPGLQCRVRSVATGSEIPVSDALASSNYSYGSRAGVSLFDFEIDRPGIYEISGGYEDTGEGPPVVLAIGQGIVREILFTVFGGLAIVFGCSGLAVVIGVYTAVMRQRARDHAQDRYAL
ncbi:MAG: hypothetical protein ACE145_14260 [Terriglobia bacterium]